MTMSAISHYRGGTIDVVAPIAKKLKAAYLKHGKDHLSDMREAGVRGLAHLSKEKMFNEQGSPECTPIFS
jgi:hypothetical protein